MSEHCPKCFSKRREDVLEGCYRVTHEWHAEKSPMIYRKENGQGEKQIV